MRRSIVGCLCLVLVTGWLGAGVVSGSDDEKLCIPVDIIVIEPPETVEAKRSPVDFPHSVHFSYSCQTCHHKWEGEVVLKSCQASGCHDLDTSPKRSASGAVDPAAAMAYYKNAYHSMSISCHKSIEASNKALAASGRVVSDALPAAGPIGCIDCHPKE